MHSFYTNVAMHRNKILVRSIEDGRPVSYKVDYHPYLFIPAKGKETEFHTLKGDPVEKIYFENPWEMREFVKRYEGVEGFSYYGMTAPIYTFINDNCEPDMKYDASQISIVNIDIEVSSDGGFPDVKSANKQIITIALRKNGKNCVFGYFPYKAKPDTQYVQCKDEEELLRCFLTVWNDVDWAPDVITGWSIDHFDIPYLVRRIANVLGEEFVKLLSPWKVIQERTISTIYQAEEVMYDLVGISVLDYMQLYKKFSYTPQESYKLDHIAFSELKERKLDYSEYRSIQEFYEKDFQKFVDYNIHDVVLVDRLEEKKGFIRLVFAIAYYAKINFQDAFTTVKRWDVIIHNHLLKQKIVVNQMKNREGENYSSVEGAYVKDPIIGMHNWVVSFDVNSLYPSLVQQYNISPETLRGTIPGITIDGILAGQLREGDNKDKYRTDVAIAATGCMFNKEKQGFLPQIVEQMYAERVQWKNRMIEAKKKFELDKKNKALENEIDTAKNMQQALKIQMNALYGALGNQGFRWYDQRLVASITMSGQVSIKWVEKRMNAYLNKLLNTTDYDYVIACDTDSMYLRLEKLVEKFGPKESEKIVDFLDKICKEKFTQLLDKWFKDLADYVHAFKQKMEMKRETIANKAIWTGKKHYALNAYDVEGVRYKEPELKISGLEVVRSSTPSSCRTSIKEAIKVIMNKDQETLIKFVEEFRGKFETLPIEEIAFPRSINNLNKYRDKTTIYAKKTPIAVKGALVFNEFVKERGLEADTQLIVEGEKIKFVYLKMPNPTREKVVSFYELPKAVDLKQFIDYNMQFEKAFLNPLKAILTAIGWESEKRATLDDFFK